MNPYGEPEAPVETSPEAEIVSEAPAGDYTSGVRPIPGEKAVLVPELTPEETASLTPTRGKRMVRVDLPPGVSEYTFRQVIAAGYAAFLETGETPNAEMIQKYAPRLAISRINAVLSSPAYRRAMTIRGVTLDDSTGLTVEQDLAIQIIMDPNGESLQKKLKRAGVSMSKYRAWLKNPLFAQQVRRMGMSVLEDHSHDMMVALAGRATEGDLNSIKYAFELTGKYRPQQINNGPDAETVIMHFVEIVQRHLKDVPNGTEILRAIAADMSMVAAGQKLSRSKPMEITDGY